MEQMQRKYPTAGLAVIRCPADSWSSLEEGQSSLASFITPADLEVVEEQASEAG